jgi:Flp pilus assembly protein TadG
MRLFRSRRGIVSLEFAIVAAVLIPLTSAIIELGLLLWTQVAMQSVASLTARCAAIGSPQCSASVPAYAVSLASNWTLSGAITNANVTVTTTTTCGTASGTFENVAISFPTWSRMVLKPFLPDSFTVSACYYN